MSMAWFKFYPSDWRADPKLKICSLAARGLWIEMCSIAHESEPRGYLKINNKPVENDMLARLVGEAKETVENLLSELENSGVFSRNKAGVIYSRRMVSDENRARKNRENGKMGGNPNLGKQTENSVSVNPPDKAKKPETRNQIPEYKFKGKIIRLKPEDYDQWVKNFSRLDVRAELTALDAWFVEEREKGKTIKNWFSHTSAILNKRHRETKEDRVGGIF